MNSSDVLLSTHLQRDRIAHTYLFTGAEGPGKSGLVIGFAKALNCDREKSFVPCDCLSCRKIDKRNHPDVHWFGEDPESRSIKIEEVRAIVHEASLAPFEGRWKVFILQGAERLTLEAANALLKTLEEPPGHSVFLLLVENKVHLLETIQSRAFEIRTSPPPEKDPKQNEWIQLFQEKGRDAFFEALRTSSRIKLRQTLEALMFYFRDRGVSEGTRDLRRLAAYLKAIDAVYETQEALQANVNQKLALTHLEIQLRRQMA